MEMRDGEPVAAVDNEIVAGIESSVDSVVASLVGEQPNFREDEEAAVPMNGSGNAVRGIIFGGCIVIGVIGSAVLMRRKRSQRDR